MECNYGEISQLKCRSIGVTKTIGDTKELESWIVVHIAQRKECNNRYILNYPI